MKEFHIFHSSCRKCSTLETDGYGNQIYADYTSIYQQETRHFKLVLCISRVCVIGVVRRQCNFLIIVLIKLKHNRTICKERKKERKNEEG